MIKAVKGTKDLLPEDLFKWHFVEEKFREVTRSYGYNELRTPIFENTGVFSRSIGEETDIVNKEMYTFKDKGDESITLRPEMTAALVRACVEHNLTREHSLLRLWYFGPFFRYERPQKGRQRQFHQFGVECLGSSLASADAEVIMLADRLIKSLGLNQYKLLLNTLGTDETRAVYRKALIEYLESVQDKLSGDSKRRMLTNPLRVLDSKEKNDIEAVAKAPIILDFLDAESKEHFENVKQILDKFSINYEVNPFIVRGLDYYNHTIFEFRSDSLGSQDSFGGGGRYDKLFEQIGGSATPAVGFAMGVERLLIMLEALNSAEIKSYDTDIYVITYGESEYIYGLEVAEMLRAKGYSVLNDVKQRKFKTQFKEADKYQARFTVIIGEEEMANREVTLKNMATGEQNKISLDELANYKF